MKRPIPFELPDETPQPDEVPLRVVDAHGKV